MSGGANTIRIPRVDTVTIATTLRTGSGIIDSCNRSIEEARIAFGKLACLLWAAGHIFRCKGAAMSDGRIEA